MLKGKLHIVIISLIIIVTISIVVISYLITHSDTQSNKEQSFKDATTVEVDQPVTDTSIELELQQSLTELGFTKDYDYSVSGELYTVQDTNMEFQLYEGHLYMADEIFNYIDFNHLINNKQGDMLNAYLFLVLDRTGMSLEVVDSNDTTVTLRDIKTDQTKTINWSDVYDENNYED